MGNSRHFKFSPDDVLRTDRRNRACPLSTLKIVMVQQKTRTLGPCIVVVHDDVIKCKHFLRYWPFVWGIHRSLVGEFPAQRPVTRRFDVFFSNNREAGCLRHHRTHYDVIVMCCQTPHNFTHILHAYLTSTGPIIRVNHTWLYGKIYHDSVNLSSPCDAYVCP